MVGVEPDGDPHAVEDDRSGAFTLKQGKDATGLADPAAKMEAIEVPKLLG